LTYKGAKSALKWIENNDFEQENHRLLKIERLLEQSDGFKRERNYPIGKELEKQYSIGKEIVIFHPINGKKAKATVIEHIYEPPRFRRVWAIKVSLVDEPEVQLDILHSYIKIDGNGTYLLTGFEDWADR
jgi:hypothetical protein